MFGEYVKKLRLKKKMTMRKFCKKNKHDIGNWSKLERDLLPPLTDKDTLQKLAEQLGVELGEQLYFFDLAFMARGMIPPDIMQDKELAVRLLSFFKTLREKSLIPESKNNEVLVGGNIVEDEEEEDESEEEGPRFKVNEFSR